MAFCEFCKSEDQTTGTCAKCGKVFYTAGVTFIFGSTIHDSYGSEIRLSDKYLIVRSVSNGEMLGNVTAGATFGLLGALAAASVDAARKKVYAFYDLQDVQKVIFPYHAKALKRDTAFKFINKDGSDFILYFNLNGMFCGKAAKGFVKAIEQAGLPLESDGESNHPVCCEKPFVDKETFAVRVAPSAAAFVPLQKKQFVAPPIVAGAAPQPVAPQPVAPQPVYQAPPAQPAAPQPTYQAPLAPPVKKLNNSSIFCRSCGAMCPASAHFCSHCGTPLRKKP